MPRWSYEHRSTPVHVNMRSVTDDTQYYCPLTLQHHHLRSFEQQPTRSDSPQVCATGHSADSVHTYINQVAHKCQRLIAMINAALDATAEVDRWQNLGVCHTWRCTVTVSQRITHYSDTAHTDILVGTRTCFDFCFIGCVTHCEKDITGLYFW